MKLAICLIFCSTAATACVAADKLPPGALHTLYKNTELVEYVCVENASCTEGEFAAKIDVKEVNLSSRPQGKFNALVVEPTKKGKQYFTAIFTADPSRPELIFSPDTSMSGIKIMPNSKNNMRILRSTELESTEAWKQTDYGYDAKTKQYMEIKTTCFHEKNGKGIAVKCS
jgi:hypothetical protein